MLRLRIPLGAGPDFCHGKWSAIGTARGARPRREHDTLGSNPGSRGRERYSPPPPPGDFVAGGRRGLGGGGGDGDPPVNWGARFARPFRDDSGRTQKNNVRGRGKVGTDEARAEAQRGGAGVGATDPHRSGFRLGRLHPLPERERGRGRSDGTGGRAASGARQNGQCHWHGTSLAPGFQPQVYPHFRNPTASAPSTMLCSFVQPRHRTIQPGGWSWRRF